ncbi:MAG: fumarylacetoacetate hydrolase family protein [Bryobacteraceae bacterium]
MPVDVAALALRQLKDYDRHYPGLLFANPAFSLTLREAYDVQMQVAALRQQRGEVVAGYKIGCVSESVRRQLGLSAPVFGCIFENEFHHSGCILEAALYEGLAIEGEFAVRLAADTIAGPDYSGEQFPRALSSVFPVIELHNYVFRSPRQAAQELVANNAIHAGVVLPFEQPPLGKAEDLADEEISVDINGERQGTAGGTLGKTLQANLLLLAEHLQSFGATLRAGQTILTGSPLPLYRVKAGDRIKVRCRRLPEVAAAIV